MLINYHSVTGEVTEVEVSAEIGAVIVELDRKEYNINHKETRRHVSLEAYDPYNKLLCINPEPLCALLEAESQNALMAAIQKLKPAQKELIYRVFWKKETQCSIAAEEGVSKMAISKRLKTTLTALRNNLNE
jgi:RNA polymerase sigma factor (sigma-70 family)